MIKIRIKKNPNNIDTLAVYRCPHCTNVVNSNIVVCSRCYKELPDIFKLVDSPMRRINWHIEKSDPLSVDNNPYVPPAHNPKDRFDWLINVGQRMME